MLLVNRSIEEKLDMIEETFSEILDIIDETKVCAKTYMIHDSDRVLIFLFDLEKYCIGEVVSLGYHDDNKFSIDEIISQKNINRVDSILFELSFIFSPIVNYMVKKCYMKQPWFVDLKDRFDKILVRFYNFFEICLPVEYRVFY